MIKHKKNCNCAPCKSLRGEYSKENHPNYKEGVTLSKYFCVDCNKQISYQTFLYGEKRCRSCSQRKNRLGKSSGMKGKKHSKETRLKISKKTKGTNNPRYIDGRTSLLNSIRNTPEYKNWRTSVFKRDNYTCQECGKTNCYIEAHHIEPILRLIKKYFIDSIEKAVNCEELWSIDNGITLCKECHKSKR